MNRWESRTRSKRKAGEVGGVAGRDREQAGKAREVDSGN